MPGLWLYFENSKRLLAPGETLTVGRDPACDIILADSHVSRRHAVITCDGETIRVADQESTNGLWYGGKRVREITLRAGETFRIADNNLALKAAGETGERDTSGDTMDFEKRLTALTGKSDDPALREDAEALRRLYNRKKEKLSELAFVDTLTGLWNRRHFDAKLAAEVTRALRYGRELSLLMVDIDHFKAFNDTWGHRKGDEVLAAVAGLLKETLRESDIVCRYGGEEMAVILPETDSENGGKIGNQCRLTIERRSPETAGVTVTVSIGAAGIVGLRTPEELIGAADRALYRAKETGRNRVVVNRISTSPDRSP